MTNAPFQNYSYAIDKDGYIIHVSKAIRGSEYFCPHCHTFMTPHMGKIRRWHFTHKANIENCNYETYLHKIAKFKIREAFLNASKFIISFDVPAICKNRESCKIDNGHYCTCSSRIEHDIKQFYDKCEEEIPYKNFVADLLISSSSKPDREPILIEIYVTHKSTTEKITDGVRIIEVQIRTEEDINNIVSSLRIEGDQASNKYYFKDEKPKNIFFNFKGQVLKDPAYFNKIIPKFFYYLWICDSGYFKAAQCPCDDDPLKYIPSGTHYVISSNRFSWQWAFGEFLKRGIEVKNCLICKYSATPSMSLINKRICTLYKKLGTPHYPEINTAKSCPYFKRTPHISEEQNINSINIGFKG